MNKKQYDLLESCIEILTGGGTVDECKRRYPDLSEEIQDILIMVKEMMGPPSQVTAQQLDKSLNRVMSQAQNIKMTAINPPITHGISRFARSAWQIFGRLPTLKPLAGRLSLAFVITALFVILSGGLVITSAKSIPGEPLYRVKRVVEDIRVYLVPNREIRQKYEDDYNQERVKEVRALIKLNRIQTIRFEGVIESMDAANWVVSGIQVSIEGGTTRVGAADNVETFFIGSMVEVDGITNTAGGVTATRIQLSEYQFTGKVEKIGASSWQIDDANILISSQTHIENSIKIGDLVIITARVDDQGLYAIAINRKPDATGTPIATANPPNLLLPTSGDDYDEMYDSEEENSPEFDQEDNADQQSQEGIETETSEYSQEEHYDQLTIAAPTEDHEQVGTITPEPHETPDQNGEHEEDH